VTSKTPVALTIAGSDSGGGAGIQADLKTFVALGVFGTSAVTAITAQNTLGVHAVFALPATIVAAQIEAILDDFNVVAVKIGMLGDSEIVAAVAAALSRRRPPFILLDPVMVASSGDRLIGPAAIAAIEARLFPLLDCLTPNLSEAAAFLREAPARDEAAMMRQGRALLEHGLRAVLMKGGHLDTADSVDFLLTEAGARRYAEARIDSRNLHGTGCTLSAAVAGQIVRGEELGEAIARAKRFVGQAISAGRDAKLGSGPGPLLQSPLKT
jgi:hydroxymethylpyrimidine/phosphomethylpyrimidine kinase